MFKIFTLKSLETELENNHVKHRLILRVATGTCWGKTGVNERSQRTIYGRNRKEFYVSQTEDYSPEDGLSDNSEELLQGSKVFSTVFCLLRTKKIEQVRDIYLQGCKKSQVSTYTVSHYDLGTWEGSLAVEEQAPASQEGRHLIFTFNMDILYFWSLCPFL